MKLHMSLNEFTPKRILVVFRMFKKYLHVFCLSFTVNEFFQKS